MRGHAGRIHSCMGMLTAFTHACAYACGSQYSMHVGWCLQAQGSGRRSQKGQVIIHEVRLPLEPCPAVVKGFYSAWGGTPALNPALLHPAACKPCILPFHTQ